MNGGAIVAVQVGYGNLCVRRKRNCSIFVLLQGKLERLKCKFYEFIYNSVDNSPWKRNKL